MGTYKITSNLKVAAVIRRKKACWLGQHEQAAAVTVGGSAGPEYI